MFNPAVGRPKGKVVNSFKFVQKIEKHASITKKKKTNKTDTVFIMIIQS